MVDPYEFITSPPTSKSRQTRKKTVIKTTEKRKYNEKPRRMSNRKTNNKSYASTRLNEHDTDDSIDINEKENNPTNGFTQLIQTKMMEVKKRQAKRTNKKVTIVTDAHHSPLVMKKRQRSDNSDTISAVPTETGPVDDNHPSRKTDVHANAGVAKTTHAPTCELKDNYLVLANKRRRGCLCSKRQLDELEFAPDSIISQTPQQCDEEPKIQEKSYIEPTLNCPHHNSPLPLLLPSSNMMQPLASTITILPIQSVSINPQTVEPNEENKEEEEEEEEEEEKENQLHASSIMIAPLSPAMPLNATYIAHRSIPLIAPISTTLLSLSTDTLPNTTTNISHHAQPPLASSIIENLNVEPDKTDQSLLLPPIRSTPIRHDQQTSMTPAAVQTTHCSVSTQTMDDDDAHHHHPTHHPCYDVSVCPCVQIYTRSEQLFMNSMAVFFRNSFTITPPEVPYITTRNIKRANDRPKQINPPVISPELTPISNEIEVPVHIESHIEKQTNKAQINETYLISNHDDTVPPNEPQHHEVPHALLDTSTVIHETPYNNTKKSDGSSIEININSRIELNKNLTEEPIPFKSSIDDQKFKSLVLTMTALKDDQKIQFNHFIERFSVRSSDSVDETTTHLITDEDDENFLICPLTGKVLQAVARHLTIVSYRWLTACLNEQRYVDEIPNYEIIGDTVYNVHNGMSRSRLNISNNYRLLANYAFHLKCNGCQPFMDNRPLIELIHLSGGLILKTLNQHIDNIGRQIIILCSKKYLQNKAALQQACQKLNILCVEPEWLIASIVKFDIQPFEPWLCTLYA